MRYMKGALLVVTGKAGVGLVQSAVLDLDAACGHLIKLLSCLVIEVARKVLSRRIDRRERLKIVDHLVIESVYNRPHHLLQQLEVEQKPSFIKFFANQRHEHTIVMAVRILALASVIAKVVTGRKPGFYSYFKHYSCIPFGR